MLFMTGLEGGDNELRVQKHVVRRDNVSWIYTFGNIIV
jgi:hypothetical protein